LPFAKPPHTTPAKTYVFAATLSSSLLTIPAASAQTVTMPRLGLGTLKQMPSPKKRSANRQRTDVEQTPRNKAAPRWFCARYLADGFAVFLKPQKQ